MIEAFKQNWKIYFIEAWALGMFMISAALFVILIEHPAFHIPELIPSNFVRRILIGLAMGLTAIFFDLFSLGKTFGSSYEPCRYTGSISVRPNHERRCRLVYCFSVYRWRFRNSFDKIFFCQAILLLLRLITW